MKPVKIYTLSITDYCIIEIITDDSVHWKDKFHILRHYKPVLSREKYGLFWGYVSEEHAFEILLHYREKMYGGLL